MEKNYGKETRIIQQGIQLKSHLDMIEAAFLFRVFVKKLCSFSYFLQIDFFLTIDFYNAKEVKHFNDLIGRIKLMPAYPTKIRP